jgi:hypothetical protein
MECNCSHCARKGLLLWFVPRGDFELDPVATPLSSYRFNKRVIEHLFCPTCGVQCFSYGIDPHTGDPVVAVNVCCLEDMDIAKVPHIPIDGKSF